ncbi:colorectal mutant cancer protein isoform X2 [Anthonomus grandis grandis]|uniref:colorectal mutant cancer protein isoform X2 n=1 Tax=Anthonomus grandis grandis TaxID=2921223 RepID=UPI00216524E6|nr:colorectal mutant cancer protein isoform X2 [Anthonomus grandis grandis]XP_050302590.1 colorectal mutant cancer protein isoform X2 [Anthonomus grandis grandis]XP_050302661.1 colorectal mutant cancer protein isoform X2 [Anthonomus grandis grandis]XP_050302734.1 colorectal mutant cancer protein isoform X2 [Anthonomus grandis grandis]XP_050302799.1 colorectal mutant cancer protein isoform X2 [Anthonomus grandis grandis]XP_050302880.1 colorectal mutant cancer protein isoform X2 [Anthonomus gran
MHPNFLYGKILPDGRPNYLIDYGFNFQNYGPLGTNQSKCCVTSPFANDLNFGHLYTISKAEKDERTYDEPYTGDIPRKSWLCCPGSQARVECDPPALLGEVKTPTTPLETITKPPGHSPVCDGACERLQIQLDEQAQRYEEQLTELHSVIAELTRKLHQQRTMAITEEDEVSESCTSAHEDSITCPLEVSELEPLEHDLSDLEIKIPLPDSPLELPEPKLTSSNLGNSDPSPGSEIIEPLKQEIISLKQQLHEAHTRLAHMTLNRAEENNGADEETITSCRQDVPLLKRNDGNINSLYNIERLGKLDGCKTLESPESHIEVDCEPRSCQEDIKFSNIVPIHKAKAVNNDGLNIPVTKIAERIKLKRSSDREISPNDLINTELSTAVAEHIVGDILRQCDAHTEKQSLDFEIRKVNAKLEHARSQNTVLALTLNETKAHCDRLALLCGKYESNAIALRLALGITDRTIESYDVLLALLETELSINEENPVSVQNRTAAETVAKQLLSHLDSHQNSDVLLSPWQNHVYSSPIEISESWTTDHELRLREHVSRLKAERSNIQGTYVTLESTQVENAPVRPSSCQEARKMDLEMAVLMQELMGLREDKVELLSKLFVLEKDKNALEIKLKYVEGQQKAQSATLKNLQGQLKDTEGLLAIATQNKDRGYCDAEHAQGVELELMQALAREARLKVRLQELVTTLEQVTKNAEARLLEGREIVQDLNQTNSMLADTVDRNNKKYQAKFKKMEHQMHNMVEKHTAQVQTLQQKIATLETPLTNSSENSLNSIPS